MKTQPRVSKTLGERLRSTQKAFFPLRSPRRVLTRTASARPAQDQTGPERQEPGARVVELPEVSARIPRR